MVILMAGVIKMRIKLNHWKKKSDKINILTCAEMSDTDVEKVVLFYVC